MSDPKAQGIVRLITESVQVEKLRFLFAMPWIRHLFPEATGWNSQVKITTEIQNLVKDLIHEHKDSFDSNDMRDFMDVYLHEISNEKDKDFNESALTATAMDLFSAGSETTATTLSWAVLYLILYPEVQSKMQQEIDDVLQGQEPSQDDKSRYTYVADTT